MKGEALLEEIKQISRAPSDFVISRHGDMNGANNDDMVLAYKLWLYDKHLNQGIWPFDVEKITREQIKKKAKSANGERAEEGITLCMIVPKLRDAKPVLEKIRHEVEEAVIAYAEEERGDAAIVRKYEIKPKLISWNDDFAYARNKSLELATMPYILVIDDDEELSSEGLRAIREAIRNNPEAEGFKIVQLNPITQNSSDNLAPNRPKYFSNKIVRVFRNDERIFFTYPVHETVIPSILYLKRGKIVDTNATVINKGFEKEEKTKLEHYTRIASNYLSKNPLDPKVKYEYAMMCLRLSALEDSPERASHYKDEFNKHIAPLKIAFPGLEHLVHEAFHHTKNASESIENSQHTNIDWALM